MSPSHAGPAGPAGPTVYGFLSCVFHVLDHIISSELSLFFLYYVLSVDSGLRSSMKQVRVFLVLHPHLAVGSAGSTLSL